MHRSFASLKPHQTYHDLKPRARLPEPTLEEDVLLLGPYEEVEARCLKLACGLYLPEPYGNDDLSDTTSNSSSDDSSSKSSMWSPWSNCSSACTEMSLSPQVDHTADDEDTSTSIPPERNDVVISEAPVASTADKFTTEMEEAK
jgi:hypothetical protein